MAKQTKHPNLRAINHCQSCQGKFSGRHVEIRCAARETVKGWNEL